MTQTCRFCRWCHNRHRQRGAYNHMTLQQIRYVIEISNCGSIGKAAQELNLKYNTQRFGKRTPYLYFFQKPQRDSVDKRGFGIFALCKDPFRTGETNSGSLHTAYSKAPLSRHGLYTTLSFRDQGILSFHARLYLRSV